MLIIEKLQSASNLTDNEQAIGEYIFSLGREIEGVSTRVLAQAAYTSPAAVIRFCKKLGFEGFDELKTQFIREIEYLDNQYDRIDSNFPFQPDDSLLKTARKIGTLYQETAEDTLALLDHATLKKACFLMRTHETIHIFSYGTALNTAESFREKMLKIGKSVIITNNLNYQLYQARPLNTDALPILISYSGETEKILLIAKSLQERWIPFIALTSLGGNSLASMATCTLTISTKESLFENLGDFSTHISIAMLLDILYSVYFLEDYQGNYTRKLEMTRSLESRRHSENSILSGENNQSKQS